MAASYSGWHLSHHDPGVWAEPRAIDQLGAIDVPALVVMGGRDVLDVRMICDRVATETHNAVLRVIDNAGHNPTWKTRSRSTGGRSSSSMTSSTEGPVLVVAPRCAISTGRSAPRDQTRHHDRERSDSLRQRRAALRAGQWLRRDRQRLRRTGVATATVSTGRRSTRDGRTVDD